MNVLFLTIGRMESIETHALYPDLLRQFRSHGHNVYVVSAYEKLHGKETTCIEENGVHMLHVKVGNLTKCNIIEKGISTICIETQFKHAIKKYFQGVIFDLVLYSTPPITLAGVVKYIKKRDNAKTYLLLKDIFPQNAIDLGLLKKSGVKGLIYRYFRLKEKNLYNISDMIGCMSQANVEYLLKHNPEVKPDDVEICPNAIEPIDISLSAEEIKAMRLKYDIPLNRKIFVYGGNLGKPQGIHFLVDCLRSQLHRADICFLIVGDGMEYPVLRRFVQDENPANVKLMSRLPKEDYDRMIAACDVGMIFLDHRFTIPNFPSRLLPYMQAKLPVLAVTDPNTDLGQIITEGGFGAWCESKDVASFDSLLSNLDHSRFKEMGARGFDYLKSHYTSEKAYRIIMGE